MKTDTDGEIEFSNINDINSICFSTEDALQIIYYHGDVGYLLKAGQWEGRGEGLWIGQQLASLAASSRPDWSTKPLSADLLVCA